MPYQRALTIVAPVRAGARGELESLLATMGNGVANGSVLDFGELSGVHFARLAVVEEDQGLPAHLILLSDIDVPAAKHLGELAAAGGLDRIFGHCEGYSGDRLGYLRRHTVKEQATLREHARPHREPDQAGGEAPRRDPGLPRHRGLERPRAGGEVRRAVREHVQADPELAWALEPAERPGGLARLREKLHLIAIPLLLLPFCRCCSSPCRSSPSSSGSTSAATARRRTSSRSRAASSSSPALEDHLVQNPFMAVGHVKPGEFRLLTLRAVLFGLNYTTRHIFNRGNLSGVKTIHFARWVFLDGKRRMFFASNYDGSMESYMDDFIDKVAWGLNLVFSNGVGYPKTRWLVFGGAKHELAFKDFLRVHQVPTRVWYSAYGDLTALNIAQNERIRAGLRGCATSRSGCSRCDARARRRPGALRPRLRRPEVGGVPAAEGRGRGRRAALARRGEP